MRFESSGFAAREDVSVCGDDRCLFTTTLNPFMDLLSDYEPAALEKRNAKGLLTPLTHRFLFHAAVDREPRTYWESGPMKEGDSFGLDLLRVRSVHTIRWLTSISGSSDSALPPVQLQVAVGAEPGKHWSPLTHLCDSLDKYWERLVTRRLERRGVSVKVAERSKFAACDGALLPVLLTLWPCTPAPLFRTA